MAESALVTNADAVLQDCPRCGVSRPFYAQEITGRLVVACCVCSIRVEPSEAMQALIATRTTQSQPE